MQSQIKVNYPQTTPATIVIATSTTVSAAVDLGDYDLVGIETPSTFDGTNITFQGSTDNSTFVAVAASNAASTAYTVVTTTSTGTPINPQIFAGYRYVKVVCATAQTTTDTIIKLLLRKRT